MRKTIILWMLLAGIMLMPALSLGETAGELTLEVTLDKTRVDISEGEVITGTWQAHGGTGPYTYVYYWRIYGEFQNSLDRRVDDTKASFQPLFGETGELYVNAVDSMGQFTFREIPFTITGGPGPVSCDIWFDKSSVMPGEPITANWTISGGKAPYDVTCRWVAVDAEYSYSYHPEDETKGKATFVPDELGSVYFVLEIRDAFSVESSFKSDDLIVGSAEPIVCNLTLSSREVSAGKPITATWTISGGNPPYIVTCEWRTSDADSNWQTFPEDETGGTASFVPPTGGWAYFFVTIKDARGDYESAFSDSVLVHGEKEPIVNYTDKMLNDKVAEIASACMTAVSGEYSRAKWLHDWLIENARYDYTFTYYSPKGVLLAGKGVCQSFSEAYQLLLNKVGISNKLVSGEANNGTKGWEGHAWNLVSIGGVWYHVDVTWDDTGDHYEYFLKSDQFMSKNHRWSASRYPVCPSSYGEASASKIPGDANGDNTVDILDLVSIIDYIVSNTDPTSLANADANGDGTVDILDLVWVIDVIVGG